MLYRDADKSPNDPGGPKICQNLVVGGYARMFAIVMRELSKISGSSIVMPLMIRAIAYRSAMRPMVALFVPEIALSMRAAIVEPEAPGIPIINKPANNERCVRFISNFSLNVIDVNYDSWINDTIYDR